MIALLFLAAVFLGCGLMYGIICFADSRATTKIDFNETQKKVIKDLNEKKNAYEKEMTKDVLDRITTLREQQRQLEDEGRAAEREFEKRQKQLEEDYNFSRLKYEEMDRAAEEIRQKKNEEKITAEQEEIQTKLTQLKDWYHREKGELSENFQQFRENINSQKATLSDELKAYEEQQKQVIERFKKDEEIRQQRDFYHIKVNDAAAQDVVKLKALALQFSKPEILYKLLYETYYKTQLEELFKRVLGDNKDSGGIYKITNIENEKVYIGKTTNFLTRWRTHAKRGCNIERIKGQLYDAMFENGLDKFSWEIVEVCPKEQQSEKEKYWIKFYNTESYGYNMKQG